MSQNDKIEQIVERVYALTRDYKHEYVTLEHLLFVLLDTEEIQDIMADSEQDHRIIQGALSNYLETEVDSLPDDGDFQPKKTVMLERVFNRAITQALFNGRQHLDPRDLLISILSENNTPAVHLLANYNITRDTLVGYLSDATTKTEPTEAKTNSVTIGLLISVIWKG